MDLVTAKNILNNRTSTKEELREALAFAVGVPYKEKYKKQVTAFTVCRDFFCEEYTKYSGIRYSFGAKDGKSLANLLKKIEKIVDNPLDDQIIINAFKVTIQRLPDWYRQNGFSLSVIDSKFNEIVSAIKKNGKQQSTAVTEDYKQRVIDDLLA
jgi:hypothetical protein